MNNEDESPCNGKCFIESETATCTGCLRTLEEITNWTDYSGKEKEAVLKKIEMRKKNR